MALRVDVRLVIIGEPFFGATQNLCQMVLYSMQCHIALYCFKKNGAGIMNTRNVIQRPQCINPSPRFSELCPQLSNVTVSKSDVFGKINRADVQRKLCSVKPADHRTSSTANHLCITIAVCKTDG